LRFGFPLPLKCRFLLSLLFFFHCSSLFSGGLRLIESLHLLFRLRLERCSVLLSSFEQRVRFLFWTRVDESFPRDPGPPSFYLRSLSLDILFLKHRHPSPRGRGVERDLSVDQEAFRGAVLVHLFFFVHPALPGVCLGRWLLGFRSLSLL